MILYIYNMLIQFLLHILKISITEDRFFFEEGGIVLSMDLDYKRGLITREGNKCSNVVMLVNTMDVLHSLVPLRTH